ncbi:hypothetical protein JOQ06_000123, partial [Pogonophryne albipinna]
MDSCVERTNIINELTRENWELKEKLKITEKLLERATDTTPKRVDSRLDEKEEQKPYKAGERRRAAPSVRLRVINVCRGGALRPSSASNSYINRLKFTRESDTSTDQGVSGLRAELRNACRERGLSSHGRKRAGAGGLIASQSETSKDVCLVHKTYT